MAPTKASFDLSVVVNLHAEGRLAHSTLRCALAAIRNAENEGLSVELLLVVDNPSEDMVAYLADQKDLLATHPAVTVSTVSFADVGANRNFGATQARGEFICFADGDNLFSANWLSAAVHFLRAQSDERLIAHPAYFVRFGAGVALWPILDSRDPNVSYLNVMARNPWDAAVVVRRKTVLEVPYPLRQAGRDVMEDWYWNYLTLVAGYHHVPVPETTYFYRVRPGLSLLAVRSRNRILMPAVPLDDLRRVLPEAPPEIEPSLPRNRLTSAARAVVRGFVNTFARLAPHTANRLYHDYIQRRRMSPAPMHTAGDVMLPQVIDRVARHIAAASGFEPQLATLPEVETFPMVYSDVNDTARVIADLVDLISGDADYILLVDVDSEGSGIELARNYAAVVEHGKNLGVKQPRVIATGGPLFRQIPRTEAVEALAIALRNHKPTVVHVIDSEVGFDLVRQYGPQLKELSIFVASALTLDAESGHGHTGYLQTHTEEFFDHVSAVFASDSATLDKLREVTAMPQNLGHVHPHGHGEADMVAFVKAATTSLRRITAKR